MDKIGEIRRAWFEEGRAIKEIVRTLSVSRATVRKVIRGRKTEFKYARDVQPSPKLGEWVAVLTEILEKESRLPKRERRTPSAKAPGMRCPGMARTHAAADSALCWRVFQFHGSSSSMRLAGWSGSVARTWASQACGSTSFSLQVSMSV